MGIGLYSSGKAFIENDVIFKVFHSMSLGFGWTSEDSLRWVLEVEVVKPGAFDTADRAMTVLSNIWH
jgi:hypothetical protein